MTTYLEAEYAKALEKAEIDLPDNRSKIISYLKNIGFVEASDYAKKLNPYKRLDLTFYHEFVKLEVSFNITGLILYINLPNTETGFFFESEFRHFIPLIDDLNVVEGKILYLVNMALQNMFSKEKEVQRILGSSF